MSRIIAHFPIPLLVSLTLLPPGSSNAEEPQFEFAYTSSNKQIQAGVFLHTRGGDRLLTKDFSAAEAPSWSPDGKQFAFHAKVNDQWDIYIMDLRSRESRRLTNDPAYDTQPVWSPAGDTIAFPSDRNEKGNIWLIDVDGGNLRQFPIPLDGVPVFAWSPDGKKVVFCANRRLTDKAAPPPDSEFLGDPDADVYIASAEGKNPRRITKTGRLAMSPAWSPDGKQLAFALTEKPGNLTNIQIHVVNIDGSGLKKLTDDPGQNTCPKWSPDGDWLLYHHSPRSEATETPSLIYISADGKQKQVIDVGPAGGYFPDFRKASVKR